MAKKEIEEPVERDADTSGSHLGDTGNGVSLDESCPDSAGESSSSVGDATFVSCSRGESLKLPDTVTILDGQFGSKVYLIGTAHFSEKSQHDVEETIRKIQPNVVVLELCESRVSILSFDEKTILEQSKSMNIAKLRSNMKEYGVVQGMMYILLLTLSAHLTRELGMAPGGEFRKAYKEAKKIPGCIVHLGDRPIHITLRRAISSLSVWQKMKLAYSILFNKESISKEEVEKYKQRDLLEEMLAEMTGEFPALSQVFVDERDTYLAYSLRLAALPIPDISNPRVYKPAIVVGVVGIGHVSGIVKQWNSVIDSDIPPLLTIPQRSQIAVLVFKGIKFSVLGFALWGCYRYFIPRTISDSITTAPRYVWGLISDNLFLKRIETS